MKTSSAKAKGRRLQQQVAADIVRAFALEPDDVTSRPSSSPGTDILLSPQARSVFPWAVECKNVEKLSLWAAWDQAVANELPVGFAHMENWCPSRALVIHSRNHRPYPLAILRWSDFLTLQQRANIGGVL
jgi:hypothetical protein